MKLAIMQPYFLPYLGYWQLITAVDEFVIYDNIQYTKKGWFNRNRYLLNGCDTYFTLPIKNDSDFLDVNQRFLTGDFNKHKLISQFKNAYGKAPYFFYVMPLVECIINFNESNLFRYTFNSITAICNYLDINTKIIISSTININHNLKGQEKVLAICRSLNCEKYINPIGGTNLYSHEKFLTNGLILNFIKMKDITYKQFNNDFIPGLSIIDVLMFNGKENVKKMLQEFIIYDNQSS